MQVTENNKSRIYTKIDSDKESVGKVLLLPLPLVKWDLNINIKETQKTFTRVSVPVEGAVHQVPGPLLRRSNLAAQGQAFCVQDPGFLT